MNADALSQNPVLPAVCMMTADYDDSDDDSEDDGPTLIDTIADIYTQNDDRETNELREDTNLDDEFEPLSTDSDDDEEKNETGAKAANEIKEINTIEIQDNIEIKNGTIAWFANENGEPLDSGGKILVRNNKVIKLKGTKIRGGETWYKRRKSRQQFIVVLGNAENKFNQLAQALRELKILSIQTKTSKLYISETKEGINDIPWNDIIDLIRIMFSDTAIKILICTNRIIVPPVQDRSGIIEEYHTSAA